MMGLPISPSELIMLLFLWLPGQPTGQPARARAVFRYVPAQAEFTVGVDAGSLTSSALRGFRGLGQEAFIRRSPDLLRRYKAADKLLQRGLGTLKLMGNVDLANDLRWITFSGTFSKAFGSKAVGGGEDALVVAVGGKFKPTLVDRLAAAKGASSRRLPNGRLFTVPRSGKLAFGWTRDDVFLVGDRAMVEKLLRRKPRPTRLARLAMSQHDRRSFFTAAVIPSAGRFMHHLGQQLSPSVRPLLRRLAGMALALRYDGFRLALAGRDGRVLGRYQRLLDGLGDYAAATELVARGSFKIGDGLISPKDARFFPRALRALVARKGEVLRYVRKQIALAASPSHGVAIDARRRLAMMTYRGSRYVGLVPILGLLGGLSKMMSATSQRRVPSHPYRQAPPHQRPSHP